MHLAELAGRRVAVLGLGIDTTAALPVVAGAGPAELLVVEDGPLHAEARGIEHQIVPLHEAATWAEVFVRSPGFPRYEASLVAARERGAAMTTPLDLWLGTHGADRTVIAVTGTKGKSTVTDLVGRLAADVGLRVGVAGNLGVPVFSPGWDGEAPIVVLEVSSYQAADLHHVPDVAVLTFLAEDHLSWHGGREWYVADKLRVLRNESGTARRILVGEAGGDAAAALAAIGLEPEVVAPPSGPVEVPRHRIQNAALAAAAVAAVGGRRLDADEILAAARTSLPGRLDECPGPDRLRCVDDALASNPSAAAAGLAWARDLDHPTVVILGGVGRGVSAVPLAEEAARWRGGRLHAVTLPDNGRDLADAAGIGVLEEAGDVEHAVLAAAAALPGEGIILFSPAAPTPGRIGTWADRSEQFRQAVARLT